MGHRPNILIIKLGALGDFVMQMDCVQAIYRAYPDAHITFMTTAPFVGFVKCLDFVENILVDSRPRFNLKEWYKTCKTGIADQKWDFVFDLQSSSRTLKKYRNIVRFLTPHSFKWVRIDKGGFDVLDVQKKGRFSWGRATNSQMQLKLLPPDLSFCKGEQAHFAELPKEKFLLIIPGCSALHPYKRWPAERYLEIVKRAEKVGVPAVVLGTNAEGEEIDFICNHSKALSFKSKASLLDFPALAARALCIIGNDTGPVHMACLGFTKAIVLFSARTKNSAQNRSNVKNFIGEKMTDISTEAVFKEVVEIIEEGQKNERKID